MNQLQGIWTGIVAIIVLGSLGVWLIAWGRPLNTFVATTVTPGNMSSATSTASGSDIPTPTKTAESGRAVAVANKDVVSIVSNISGITEFRSLLFSSGIASTISARSATKYTIFVPTNAAFGRLPRGTITSMTATQKKRLVQYHIVSGSAIDPGATISGSIPTLAGESLNFSAPVGGQPLVGSARIVAEYQGTNGTVYLIDGVLLPPQVRTP